MPSACERFIQTTLLGALLLPLAWAARPVFEFDEGSSPSSFAQQSEHAHATLTVNEIEKFEVVQISKKEMIRLRTQGMRLHEVKHRHFNRDPKGPNSMHEEYEEDENEDSNEEVFSVTPRGQFKAAPSKKHIADALLEKEAGNATVDGSFPKSVKTCPEHVKSQWYDLSFAIRDKGNGHVYLTCEGQADGDELKASCIPKECGGDAWCFVKRGCGGIRGRCRKMDGVDPRQCQKASTTESLDNDGGRGGTTATTTTTGKPSTESEAFAPPLKISPSQMTGYVCAQFDLDLTMLSGGVFPGMFSVGLLGDVHYIPSTQCWGWTNELYLQFSLGLDIGGVNFRISFVFIATLVVTEQPLNAARDQLSWELPYKLDTSVCHTKDPFTLIERTLKRQWKYILTHVLTLRETPEEKVATALENYDKENNFAQYVPLLQQDGAPRKYQLLGPKGTIAEDTETEALVKPGSKEAGLLRMNITRADKTITVQIGVAEVPDDVEMLKLIVWQDWDAMIARQESNLFRLVDMAGNFKTDQITWSFQLRGHSIVVGAVHLLSSGGSKTHIGPFTIGTKSYVKVGPIRHGEDPMWQKTGFLRQLDIGFREFLGREVGHTGTLAITSFNITKHNCRHQPEFARVSIKAAADRVEEATWYWKDMGSKAPWGVHVTRKHGMEDMPNEVLKLMNGLKPIVSLGSLLRQDVVAILRAGLKAASSDSVNFRWHPIWNTFVSDLRKAVEHPASSALDMIGRGPVTDFVHKLLWSLRNSELDPDDLDLNLAIFISQLQYRLQEFRQTPDRQHGWKWAHLAGRSTSTDPQQCMKLGPDKDLNSTEACREACRQMRPVVCKDRACTQGRNGLVGKARSICNVARTDTADGICTLWHCISWENFPHMDAYDIDALLPEDDVLASPMPFAEILKHITQGQLADGIEELSDDEFRGVVDGVSKIEKAVTVWHNAVTRVVLPEKTEITSGSFEPDWNLLNIRALKDLLTRCLVSEGGWPRVPQIVTLLKAEFGHNESAVPVKVVVQDTEGRSGRQSLTLSDQLGEAANEWTKAVEISSYNCKISASIEWKWQLSPPEEGFFKRPKLVGVSQALFAAYDQFASKLPAYGAQVQERLDPPPKKGILDSIFGRSVLPYKNSDGRFLHRHLKKGEHENIKVHAGDLGTDDAVYNFPKVWEQSRYARTPSFQYNAGLSLANLFLRVVSDFQALFFLYFADHPDWDGQCASLPAKFNLFHEHPKGEHAWERTNWEEGAEPSTRGKRKREDDLAAPPITHRAGSTVSELGKKMAEDDFALFRDWHWVSKPYWFGSDEKRAGFMTKTSPIHGKDAWATANVSAMSAEMWPHLWCELVNQYWVKDETDIVAKQTKEESDQAAREVEELLSGAEAAGTRQTNNSASITSSMISALKSVKVELTSAPFHCIAEESDNHKQSDVEKFVFWQLRDGERAYAESINHTERVGHLFQEVVNFLRVDLHQAEKVEDEDQAKAMQTEIAKLESTAETLVKLRSDFATSKARLGRIKAAIFLSWKLSAGDSTPDPGVVAKYRAQFSHNKKQMEQSQEERASFLEEAQNQVERLLNNYPHAEQRDDDNNGVVDGYAGVRELGDIVTEDHDDVEKEDGEVEVPSEDRLEDIRRALKFSQLLLTSVKTSQKRILEEFQMMNLCVDLAGRPPALAQQRFLPWVPLEHKNRRSRLNGVFKNLLKEVDTATNIDGIDLWFEKACRVSTDFNFSKTASPIDEISDEPRHECERVLLSKQLVTIFPSFTERAVISFKRLQEHLDKLMLNPTDKKIYNGMESIVRRFIESFRDVQDLDNDFLTAFAYKDDGSLSGDLWASLKDSSATIVASLQERSSSRRDWITESIRDKALLQHGRRIRVRDPEPPKPEIPANSESCVCRDDWTAWVWYTFPVRRRFTGCATFPADGGKIKISSDFDTSGWKGFCRTKLKRNSPARCADKWAPCDPNVTVDTRPEFRIWRRDHAKGVVTLPLVQTDLYMSFDIRSSRADFCTPNFAPLLIKKTKQWSSASWVPWELRKVDCYGARIHPPGISLLVMRCEHGVSGAGEQSKQPRSVEWQVVITAYLISYYNTWGTSDGDMTSSWFDGSWGGATADKGFPGVLTGTTNWANSASGFGYMNTASAMQSAPSFWFAVIAEVLGVFQTTKALSDASASSSSERVTDAATKVGAMGTLSLVAAGFWSVLQKWGCVPLAWGISIGTSAVAKYLADVVPITLSGFRNEHDVILALQWTYMSTKTVREATDLIRELSKEQLEHAMVVGERVVPFSQYWKEYQQLVGNSPDHIRHLSHNMLQVVVKKWIDEVTRAKGTNALGTCTERMFESCEIRPRWYKVNKNSKVKVHAFYGTSYEKWLDEKKTPQDTLFLISAGAGWFREILDQAEEDHFYPEDYIKRGALELYYETIDNRGHPRRQMTPTQFDQLLKASSKKDLQCWATVARYEIPDILKKVQQTFMDQKGVSSKDDVVPAGYFAREYMAKFYQDTWAKYVHGKNRTKLAELLFRRDDSTKYKFNVKRSRETNWYNRHNWGISLQMLHRIGLPFLKIPAIFQVQPYVQLAIAYNVKEIIEAIKARIGAKSGPSMLQSHKARVEACKACVRVQGSAFCDRHSVASSMLKNGWDPDMDECMPRTAESKTLCQSFAWKPNNSEALGRPAGVFEKQMCPCYNQRSGERTGPRWITSESHCAEMRWPNADSEADRRQMKASDWKLGFTNIGKGRPDRLSLGDELNFQGRAKGCDPGYECCQSWRQGEEVQRCVELDGITKATHWWYRKKCYNFHPTDIVTDKKWKKVQPFLCAPTETNTGSGFNGSWMFHEGKWVEKATATKSRHRSGAEVLDGDVVEE